MPLPCCLSLPGAQVTERLKELEDEYKAMQAPSPGMELQAVAPPLHEEEHGEKASSGEREGKKDKHTPGGERAKKPLSSWLPEDHLNLSELEICRLVSCP